MKKLKQKLKKTLKKGKTKRASEFQHSTNNIHVLPGIELSITRYVDLNVFDNINFKASGYDRQEAQRAFTFMMRKHEKLLNKQNNLQRKKLSDDRPRGIG